MSLYTIAFYNLENLFDTINDPDKMDDDFTPDSDRKWNDKRLDNKTLKLGQIISCIGQADNNYMPALIGVAEVENKLVLDLLLDSKYLKDKGYKYVHYDSPDERGIDTALLYRDGLFKVIASKAHEVDIYTTQGVKDLTRDVLHVHGELHNQEVHILVNHWPSRRAGLEETNYRRMAASKKNRTIIAQILAINPNARIIIMGDFNDDPHSDSISHLMQTDFYNPMQLLHTKYKGSTNFRGGWNLFDQIIVSNNFMKPYDNPFSFNKANIFDGKLVEEHEGRFKGNPFRTYAGDRYLGGASDHFPVYGIFEVE